MNPRQPAVQCHLQEADVRGNSKPGIVRSTVQTQMEMVDLTNKQHQLTTQPPARTWCLAAVLCLVASITIVCTTLWATSLFSLSAISTHHTKTNESELYNEDLMKQYIARRYPQFGIQNEPLISTKNKSFNIQEEFRQKQPDNIQKETVKNDEDQTKRKTLFTDNYKEKDIEKDVVPINHRSQFENVPPNGREPDDTMGYVTSITKEEFTGFSKDTADLKPSDTKNMLQKKLNSSIFNSLQEIFGEQLTGQPKFPDYGPDSYFYSEYDANSYYSNYDELTWTGYVLEKIQDLHDWITSDNKNKNSGHSVHKSATIPQILEALNITLLQGDISVLILKLKDLYVEAAQSNLFNDTTELNHRGREILTNTSSATSFGLLTLDILLLRNLHLMMWDNQRTAIHEVLRDSEVFAMNALFMKPEQVRRIYEMLQRAQSRGRDTTSEGWLPLDIPTIRDSLTSHFYTASSLGHDIVDFTFSIIRAAANLARAFRISRIQKSKNNSSKQSIISGRENSEHNQEDEKITELDCIWTVYCRNLDKATRNSGVFGFLAKLNSIGLRLIIGEVKIERVIDVILQETFKGSKPLNCDGLFPRCSNKNAAKIVLEGIMAVTPNSKHFNHRARH